LPADLRRERMRGRIPEPQQGGWTHLHLCTDHAQASRKVVATIAEWNGEQVDKRPADRALELLSLWGDSARSAIVEALPAAKPEGQSVLRSALASLDDKQ